MDSGLALLSVSLVEAYLLQRSLLPDWAFRSVTVLSLAGNLTLRLIWGLVVYPYFVTPLRHLPTLPVCHRFFVMTPTYSTHTNELGQSQPRPRSL